MPHNLIQIYKAVVDAYAGADQYWDKVSALIHFDGTSGARAFKEEKGLATYVAGSAALTNARILRGTTSGGIYAAGDVFGVKDPSNLFSLGSGDFTLEVGVFLNSVARGMIMGTFQWATGYRGGWGIFMNTSGELTLEVGSNTALVRGPKNGVTAQRWTRITITRKDDTLYLFIDGTLQATGGLTAGYVFTEPARWDKDLRIGSKITDGGALDDTLLGNYDEVRITKGLARYTASYAATSFPAFS